ncbi:MAG: bifunctional folylpolyglutamate synthase/dihydrofolate synthase [Candidatus Hydrogenedentes bacterium]|nr:bifunctional folylpolyglutamate synthase/dihydrofolate synthase [Candidatus Hydrogenedentota bacterium]
MNPREYLAGLEFHGIKLGLDNITYLLNQAGRPHTAYPTVHVAGTNGKGSVVAMLDAMLRAAGYCVGRFTSPHLIQLNERFIINAQPIDDGELDSQIEYFRNLAEQRDAPPTYFELCTAIAFRWFQRREVDAAIIEVGMGGRFDSTNVITPLACAITNIDLEHTQYLGDTRAKIAFEKAGIIKRGVPTVVSEKDREPLEVILARARDLDSRCYLLGDDFTYTLDGTVLNSRFTYRSKSLTLSNVSLGLAGRYQGENAAAAVALAERIQTSFPNLTANAIQRGLETAQWPCRLERVLEAPPVFVDVAHNPAGMRKLAAELGSCIVVMAVSSDKAAVQMCDAIAPVARELILTQYAGHRGLPVDALCAAAGNHRSFRRVEQLDDAIAAGMALASNDCPLVVTGSVFTAGQAREILIEDYGAKPLLF